MSTIHTYNMGWKIDPTNLGIGLIDDAENRDAAAAARNVSIGHQSKSIRWFDDVKSHLL